VRPGLIVPMMKLAMYMCLGDVLCGKRVPPASAD
jgi:hypothetical protein